MISCKEVSKLVSASLDRRLSMSERLRVRLHLLICTMCRRYARQIAFINRIARKLLTMGETKGLNLELSVEARNRIDQTIKRQAALNDRR